MAEAASVQITDEPAVDAADVARRVRAVAFDCYGTLLQFEERQFGPFLHDFLQRHGVTHVDGDKVWSLWMAASREQAERDGHKKDAANPHAGPEPSFKTFAERWPAFFERAFSQAEVEQVRHDAAFQHIWELMQAAPAYPEAHDVLAGLRARGYRIAVASNADDAHLLPALERAGMETDLVLSSEGARSYKPRRPFYRALCERLALPPAEVLYVGDSPYADVAGATHSGLPVYWVRRYRDEEREEDLRCQPTWTQADLRGLLEVLPGAPA